MKESTGYVFRSGNRWYARITAKDQATGRRRNIKRTAQSKADAKRLLKELAKQVQTEGVSAVDALRLTFGDLAKHYLDRYAIPARIVDGQKIEGMRDYKRIIGFVSRFCKFFTGRKLREISHSDLARYRSLRLSTWTQYKKHIVQTIPSPANPSPPRHCFDQGRTKL